MSDIDDLLNELKEEYQTGRTPERPPATPKTQSPPSDSIDRLLNEIKGETAPAAAPERKPTPSGPPEPEPDLSGNLHLVLTPGDEAAREKRRRAALKEKARRWLARLKPDSDEGRWFEDFSHSYESRLEAAVAYLEALKEVEK